MSGVSLPESSAAGPDVVTLSLLMMADEAPTIPKQGGSRRNRAR